MLVVVFAWQELGRRRARRGCSAHRRRCWVWTAQLAVHRGLPSNTSAAVDKLGCRRWLHGRLDMVAVAEHAADVLRWWAGRARWVVSVDAVDCGGILC